MPCWRASMPISASSRKPRSATACMCSVPRPRPGCGATRCWRWRAIRRATAAAPMRGCWVRCRTTCCPASTSIRSTSSPRRHRQGARPALLQAVSDDPWRHQGDARERLELLATRLVEAGECPAGMPRTAAVLGRIAEQPRARARCLRHAGTAAAVARAGPLRCRPGPAARPRAAGPTCCRPGATSTRSTRAPSPRPPPGCWASSRPPNWSSATCRSAGDYPAGIGLSVWGTATMRTGGDDLAQAFALIGVRPKWAAGSQRVVDFEVLPTVGLGRAAHRRHAAHLGLLPRCLPGRGTDVRRGRCRPWPRRRTRMPSATRSARASCARRGARGRGPAGRGRAHPGRLARVRLGARSLRLGPAAAVRQRRLAEATTTSPAPMSAAAPMPTRAGQRRRARHRGAGAAPRRNGTWCCRTRTAASTTCSTRTTTTSSRAAWPPPCAT